MPDVKFCGITRLDDASLASELGARYIGVIFAQSPRRLEVSHACEIAAAVTDSGAHPVGVFGPAPPDEVASVAEQVGLDVVQLHGETTVRFVESLRRVFDGEIWAVARVDGVGLPSGIVDLADIADGLLLDTASPASLGGTGQAFDWHNVSAKVASVRSRTRLIVAGGLRPGNVAEAIAALSPDVVDVSSGVESAPGIKSPELMRAFVDAVRGARR